jgi:hypothetical protein
MRQLTYFCLLANLEKSAPTPLFTQEERDGINISPHARIAGYTGSAYIESELLARQYLEALMPVFQKRYGNKTTIEIVRWECCSDAKTLKRIQHDSDIIKKRIATNNFTPNKAPE